ncbi:MAG: FIST N-terminal domain-containing protein [Gammaproteobacteria bacterium]
MRDRFRLAHAQGMPGATSALVDDCLAQLGTLSPATNVGFVYATDALADEIPAVIALLQHVAPDVQWTGTVGYGICATAREYYDTPALALMTAALPPDEIRMLSPQRAESPVFSAEDATWLARAPQHLGVLHGDPSQAGIPAFITRLAETVPGAFCVGGLTSSRGDHPQVAGGVTGGAVSGLLCSAAIPVVTRHTQGCTPIGPVHQVTACEGNIVIELDDRPALAVFKEDVGDVIAHDLRRAAGYIFAALPIAGSDTGDYLVRNLLGIDPSRQLLAIGETLAPGATLMFCRRDGNSARTDLQRMLREIASRLGEHPRGALYYSCLARGRHQFGDQAQELRMVADALGDLPLVGFFANGEIFHNRLYAYTGVLTVFT